MVFEVDSIYLKIHKLYVYSLIDFYKVNILMKPVTKLRNRVLY